MNRLLSSMDPQQDVVKSTNDFQMVGNRKHSHIDESHETIDIQMAISHYMPPRFPMYQVIDQNDVTNFKELWDFIYHNKSDGTRTQSLLSSLFDSFYDKLFERSETFKRFFGGDFKLRCKLLTKQMMFFTTLDLDHNVQKVFDDLGRMHTKMGISNWQYSLFVEVLLESLATVLGDHAEPVKMRSATRVVSFALYKLLEATLIPEIIEPFEMEVNFQGEPPLKKQREPDNNEKKKQSKINSGSSSGRTASTGRRSSRGDGNNSSIHLSG